MEEKDEIWEKVKRDFTNDPALQEVHYARLKIHEQTKDMSDEEYIEFIKMKAKKLIGENITQTTSSH
ncbi:MAG: hypothetical protein HWN66_22285 [Candidatus Helarchaeota archaeon]|nr:hypothetical protein [Candidatus Helarchaeota archaeon]